jgi:hypothetical protein
VPALHVRSPEPDAVPLCERAHAPTPGWSRHVPTGVAVLPHDLSRPPRTAVERAVDLVPWTEFERGGHVAAMAVPDPLVEELRRFVRGRPLSGVGPPHLLVLPAS